MRSTLMSALALTAAIILPGVARADDATDRSRAIALCRAEVQAQAGDAATVRLDQARVRLSGVRVDLDVFRDGQLQNVRCDVTRRRGEPLTIASITPAVQTAALAN